MSDRVATPGGEVEIAWDHPKKGKTYLILGHGAGGNMHTPSLRSYAKSLAEEGIGCVRFNFNYVEAKKKAPDRTPVLEACWRAIADHVAGQAKSVLIGGRSMGGRIGSHIVADGFAATGLVFLAYPLHPPGKPENLRDEHLGRIGAPMLFIQGTKDPFAKPELLERTIARLPNATLHRVERGDHSHKVSGRAPAEINAELVDATLSWAKGSGLI